MSSQAFRYFCIAVGSLAFAALQSQAVEINALIDGYKQVRQHVHQKMLDQQARASESSPTQQATHASGSAVNGGFSDCNHFFANGLPPILSQNASASLLTKELCFDSFGVLHSGKSKTPVFSAERLNRAQLIDAKGEQRTNRFYPEARLPSAHRAQMEDYRGEKMDRGHLSPAGDMPSPQAMAQSFSLANIVPQAPDNNRGIWADLEKDTRKYAMRAKGDVFVITGPVFSEPVRTIGPGKVFVPSHMFKLVYDASTGKSWAHWVENTNEAKISPPISYQELTNRLGFELIRFDSSHAAH